MATLNFTNTNNAQARKRNSGYDLWKEAGNPGTEQDYELALHGISVAQVALYKRAASTPNRYDDDGGSTITYTFESGSIAFANPDSQDPDFDANSGWCRKMYPGSDDIYVVYASANANGPTDVIPASQFSSPALLSMAGAQGPAGTSGCIVPIYKASSTDPHPSSMPTRDDVKFTFASGAISNLDNGWYKEPPEGDKIWCSTACASGTGTYATILHTAWSEPTVWKEKGADAISYWLEKSATIISKDTNNSNALNPTSVNVNAKMNEGGTTSAYAGTIKLYADGTEISPASSTSTSITFNTSASVAVYTIKLFAGSTELDAETIPVIATGKNGTNGANAMTAVLTNDSAQVPTDKDGNVPAGVTFPSSTIELYRGGTKVTDATYPTLTTQDYSGCTISQNGATVTLTGITSDYATVNLKVSYGNNTYTKQFTITKQKQGLTGTPSYVYDFEMTSQTYARNKRLTGKNQISLTEDIQGYTMYSMKWTISPNNCAASFDPSDTTIKISTSSNPTLYIPYNESSIVTVTLSDDTVSTTITPVSKEISPIDETEYNHDFGLVSSAPVTYTDKQGRTCGLLSGDYFVASAVFSIGSENTVIGYPYIYDNSWGLLNISSTNDPTEAEKLLQCISDIMSYNTGKQPTDPDYINIPSSSPLYTWCVNFVAQTAVINALFSKAITLLTGGSFKSAQLTYDSTDPRFVSDGFILDSNGEAKLGKAYLRDIKIRCTDTNSVILLETQEYQPASTSISCSSKTNWCANDLYNALPSTSQTGTYNSGSSLKLMKNTQTEGTVSQVSDYSYGVYYWATGSTSTELADGNQYTIPYSGWYYINSTKKNTSYATSCAYITGGGTTILSGNTYDDVKTIYNSSFNYYITSIGKHVYLASGTVLTMHAQYVNSDICIAIEKGSVGMFDSSNWTTDHSSTDGWIVKHRVLYKQFRKNCYYSGRLIVDSSGSFTGFDSNNYKNYASINGWYNNLTAGKQTDLENSTITISGTSYTVNSVTKSSGLLEFYDSNGNKHQFAGPSTSNEGGDVGWYNITGTLYPVGQKSSLNTHNLNATEDDSDIGADKAYRYIYAKKFAGNVNGTNVSDGTSYNVWGAVFN